MEMECPWECQGILLLARGYFPKFQIFLKNVVYTKFSHCLDCLEILIWEYSEIMCKFINEEKYNWREVL